MIVPRVNVSSLSPMHPTLVREPFHRDGWVYEEKYDGWRITYRLNRMLGSAEARALFTDGALDLPWSRKPPTPAPIRKG